MFQERKREHSIEEERRVAICIWYFVYRIEA